MASCMSGSAAGGLVRLLAGSGRGEVGLSADVGGDLLLLGSSFPGPGRWSAASASASAAAASSAQVSQSTGVPSIMCVSAVREGFLVCCAWYSWLGSMLCVKGLGVEGGLGGLLSSLLSMVYLSELVSFCSLGSPVACPSFRSERDPLQPILLSPFFLYAPSHCADLPSWVSRLQN